MSPFLIFRLKPQSGLVHTHALYWIVAPWLPKSESGTRSPALHFWHLGNSFWSKRSNDVLLHKPLGSVLLSSSTHERVPQGDSFGEPLPPPTKLKRRSSRRSDSSIL